MDKKKISKEMNQTIAYSYLGLGFISLALAMWKYPTFYFVTIGLIILAGWRLFWLDKKLK
jgi:hypothetical protein